MFDEIEYIRALVNEFWVVNKKKHIFDRTKTRDIIQQTQKFFTFSWIL